MGMGTDMGMDMDTETAKARKKVIPIPIITKTIRIFNRKIFSGLYTKKAFRYLNCPLSYLFEILF